jgi:hypothetical protein
MGALLVLLMRWKAGTRRAGLGSPVWSGRFADDLIHRR